MRERGIKNMEQLNKERGVEMTKHEEARNYVNSYRFLVDLYIPETNKGKHKLNLKGLEQYIIEAEATEKEFDELKYDYERQVNALDKCIRKRHECGKKLREEKAKRLALEKELEELK